MFSPIDFDLMQLALEAFKTIIYPEQTAEHMQLVREILQAILYAEPTHLFLIKP